MDWQEFAGPGKTCNLRGAGASASTANCKLTGCYRNRKNCRPATRIASAYA